MFCRVSLLWIVPLLFLSAIHADEPNKPILVLDAGGHTAAVKQVLFTPDERELITVSNDKTIRVWDTSSGETLRVIRPPIGTGDEGRLYAAALSSDGEWLAVGGFGWRGGASPIYLISLPASRIERVLTGHTASIISLAFSPDGKWLGSGSGDTTARIWNVVDGRCEATLKGHSNFIYGVAFSPDGQRLATASFDRTVRIWNVGTNSRPSYVELRGHEREVYRVAWSGDGQTVATGGMDQTVRLWNTDGSFRQRFGPMGYDITALTFSADSRELFVARSGPMPNCDCSLFSLATSHERLRFTKNTNTVTAGTMATKHSWAATSGGNAGETLLWSTEDGSVRQTLVGKSRGVYSAAWSVDGAKIAFGCSPTGDELRATAPLEHACSLAELEFGQNLNSEIRNPQWRRAQLSLGTVMLEKTGRTTVAVIQVNRAVAELKLSQEYDLVNCFTLLPNDRAVVGAEFGLSLFDTRTGQQIRVFQGHMGAVSALAPSPDNRFVLSASSDQTLRIWSVDSIGRARTPRAALPIKVVQTLERNPELSKFLDRADGLAELKRFHEHNPESKKYAPMFDIPADVEPLLSLFFTKDDWIAWTPEGYYATSPGGERLMGWHVNNGPDKLASFYPAAQFRKTFYRPDVIKLLLKTGSVEKALEVADRERGKASKLVTVEQVLPPKVEIVSPGLNDRALVKSPLKVEAKASSVGEHPITAMRVLVDGRPYEGILGQINIRNPRLGEVRESWNVQLTPGKHQIAVQAESAVSKSVSDPIEVTLAEPRGLTRVADPDKPNPIELPNLYVLAVGISDYPGSLKLNYAARDAEVLAKTFGSASKSLYRNVEVKLITNQEATRREILRGLTWLRKQMTQRDVGILMFAGHGQKDSDGKLYLLPVDVDTDDLLGTGVPGEQLQSTLAAIPGKLILLLDACHAGAIDGERRRASSSLIDDWVRDLVTDDYGLIVMCSALGREFALESDEVQHGYFTLAVVEGLSPKGDQNKDGVIYLHELDYYVTERVKELSKGQQHYPGVKKSPNIRSFPIAKP